MDEYGVGVRRRRRRRGKLMAKRLKLSATTMPANSAQNTLVGNVTNKISGTVLSILDTAGNRFKLVGSAIQAGSVLAAAGKYTILLLEEQANVGRQVTSIDIIVS